ncbi:hypothetical protein C0J52_20312 [Blattella germanica]|nr:hypothetical protein C0J52_20312 [Blattella germanica]
MDFVAKKGFFDLTLDTELFDEFTCVLKYGMLHLIRFRRWTEIFCHFKAHAVKHECITDIIQYVLCLPGTNASVERIFSLMNKVWTSEKSHMTLNTLRAVLITKFNFNKICWEFHQFLKSNPQLLKKIISSEKYQ